MELLVSNMIQLAFTIVEVPYERMVALKFGRPIMRQEARRCHSCYRSQQEGLGWVPT